MLINNKLKQLLCWQSYWSNSERKELNINVGELEKETPKHRWKKSKPLYEIWDVVTIKSWKIKEPRKLYEKLDIKWSLKWWIGMIELRVVGYKTTKSGKRYYMGEILAMDSWKYSLDIDVSPLIGIVTVFSI